MTQPPADQDAPFDRDAAKALMKEAFTEGLTEFIAARQEEEDSPKRTQRPNSIFKTLFGG